MAPSNSDTGEPVAAGPGVRGAVVWGAVVRRVGAAVLVAGPSLVTVPGMAVVDLVDEAVETTGEVTTDDSGAKGVGGDGSALDGAGGPAARSEQNTGEKSCGNSDFRHRTFVSPRAEPFATLVNSKTHGSAQWLRSSST